ncbi:MAG: DUF1186 domain-containing protein [Fischerella sp.]|nr:DUF1186 domain-containing protein [Fischerella sp.]
MAVDQQLSGADSATLEVWAPIHAWRALGQLQAEAAIEPLMHLFHQLEDSDWVNEEMPKVYGMIGAVAIPKLQTYLADESHGVFPRITAINSLEEICKQHPDTRQKCIDVLTQQLKFFDQNPEEVNGFIVASLLELQAVESAAVIKSAFVAQSVPEDIAGTWDDLCKSLGVTPDRIPLFTDVSLDTALQTENIDSNDKQQFEEVIIDDIHKIENIATEEVLQTENFCSDNEQKLEDEIADDVQHIEDVVANKIQQPFDVVVNDVTKFVDISSNYLQLIEDVTSDVKPEILQNVESTTTKDQPKSGGKNSVDEQEIADATFKVETSQLKSEASPLSVENVENTISIQVVASRGFGRVATSQSKSKSNKRKKR